MTVRKEVLKICKNTQKASQKFCNISTKLKNKILNSVADDIENMVESILKANQKDISYAQENQIEQSKIERLTLNNDRVLGLAKSIRDIVSLEDPVGKTLYHAKRNNGLEIRRVSIPLGTMLAIFESRPNVAIDISALALKSGNSVILRSGHESINSAKVLVDIFRSALKRHGVDQNLVTLIEKTDREYVKQLLKMDKYIDVVVPRGGKSLIQAVMKGTKIPIFKHLDGNCHTYVNQYADFDKARKIVRNAKLRRVSICGATESLLVDAKIADQILPLLVSDLSSEGCEIRGDNASQKIDPRIKPANAKDYAAEYLDKIISVKIVAGVTAAIRHINKFSSGHTEAIITENDKVAQKFFQGVGSAIVMQNASTQFADGGEFGLGAEVGISTGKMHARGPVGLEQLTTYKYIVTSDCAIRP